MNICSESQVTLKALQAARRSPLIKQYQKAVEVIYIRQTVGLYWVRGNELTDKLARDGSVQKFVGPEPSLGVSRQSIRRKIRYWLDSQHWKRWRGLGSTQRQAGEIILGPSPDVKTRLLSFNRTQFRVVIGLLTGHNTLRRQLDGVN